MRALLLCGLLLLLSIARADMLAPGVGLRGTFYANKELTVPTVTRYDGVIDFSWTADTAPVADMKPGAFSAKWQGFLLPAFSETYTFTITATGGVRLLVDEKCVIDNQTPHALKADTGKVTLQAGKLTPIQLRTTQPAGAGSIKLQWNSPSRPLEVIPATRLYPPLFSPALLVYSENPELRNSSLFVTALDGTAKKLTVEGSGQPVFSQDGKKVLFRTTANIAYPTSGIYQIAPTGRNQNQLTRPGGERYDPTISANGQVIAFVNNTDNAWEIWTMHADGTGKKCVVQNAFENRHPALAPDGSYLIYQSRREGKWNLFRVKVDGSEETQLTTLDGTEPIINRRGDQVAFISSRNKRPQVFLMYPDGSNQTQLAVTTGADSQPFFLRSGTQLGFIERDAKGKSNVFLTDLTDRILCQLTASGKVYAAAMTDILQMPAADNLVFWLNAMQQSTMSLDEKNGVASWMDSSAHGFLAAQTNPDARPVYHAAGLNGNPTVFWTGGSRLLVPDISAGWTSNEGTMIILFVPSDDCPGYTVVHQDNSGGGEHWRWAGNGDAYIGTFRPGRHENYPAQMPATGPILLTIVSGAQYTAYLNGTAQPPRGVSFLRPTTLTIGIGGDAGYFKGDIAELAIYDRALNDDERQMVENYFREQYGVK